jgi:hypothetical protein
MFINSAQQEAYKIMANLVRNKILTRKSSSYSKKRLACFYSQHPKDNGIVITRTLNYLANFYALEYIDGLTRTTEWRRKTANDICLRVYNQTDTLIFEWERDGFNELPEDPFLGVDFEEVFCVS